MAAKTPTTPHPEDTATEARDQDSKLLGWCHGFARFPAAVARAAAALGFELLRAK